MATYVRLQAMLSDLGFNIQNRSSLPAGVTQTTVLRGAGTPAGVVAAPVGTLYLRTDGAAATTLYVKTSGGSTNAGWTVVTSA